MCPDKFHFYEIASIFLRNFLERHNTYIASNEKYGVVPVDVIIKVKIS